MRAIRLNRHLPLTLLFVGHGLLAQPAEPVAVPSGWQTSAGASAISVPRYLGAERRRNLLLPSFEARNPNGVFLSFDKGIGIERAINDQVKISAGLAVDLDSRRRKDDARFAGLSEIHEAAALRIGADVDLGPVSLSSTWQSRLAGQRERGTTLAADLTWAIVAGEAGQLGLGITGRLMDARFARNFLSIDAAQSAASGLPAYQAGAGLLEVGPLLQGVMRLGQDWTLFGRASAGRLGSGAAGSPLVRQRTGGVLILSASTPF